MSRRDPQPDPGVPMSLHKVQAASGLAFAVFLSLHLATTASTSEDPETYDQVLNLTRMIYRAHPIVEVAMVAVPALVHITCALLRILIRRRRGTLAPSSIPMRIHRYTGYVLLLSITGHVAATRFMPMMGAGALATGKADLSFISYSLLNWPLFFDVYYLVFGLSGAVHLFLGLGIALRVLKPRLIKAHAARTIGTVGASIAGALVAAGVASMIASAPNAERLRFPEFRALYQRYLPFLKPHL